VRRTSSGDLGSRFRRLWVAFTVSNLGDGVSAVAIPLIAVSLTTDARLISLLLMLQTAPWLLVSLAAGTVVDRVDRRRLMVVVNVLRALLLLGLAALVASDRATILILLLVVFLIGCGEVLFDSAAPALVRRLVRDDQLELSNARLASSQVITNRFLGQPVGGLLYAIAPWMAPLTDGLSFGASSAVLAGLPGDHAPDRIDMPKGSFFHEATVGLRWLWGHPVLKRLALTVAVLAFVNAATTAVFVLLATERLGLGSIGFGLLLAIEALAAFGASLVVSRVIGAIGHARTLQFALVFFAFGNLLVIATKQPAITCIGLVILGVSDPMWNVVSQTLRQRLIPDHLYGRVATAYLFIAWSTVPVGAIVGGIITQAVGLVPLFLGESAIVLLTLLTAQPLFRAVRGVSEMAR
jgi:MFS family permease